MTRLMQIEGIGEKFSSKLSEAGIRSTEQLLENCSTPMARKMMAERTGISSDMLLKWINHADLFRIKGVGSEYADLLEAAGVDSVPELAQRKAENLCRKLEEINEKRQCVRKLPTRQQVEDWIHQARELPRMINY